MSAIVSSARNFVFVHVYKTAGTSITEILKPYGDVAPRLDARLRRCRWISESGLHIGNFHFFCNHASAAEIRVELGANRFDTMFSFGFVRNPWSRLVSLYHYKCATTHCSARRFDMRFDDWIAQLAHDQPRIPPQTRFLFSSEGKQLVSYIGRVEKLPEDLDYIGDKIGVSFTSLRHLNATQHGHYRDYYDPRTEQIVRRLFAPDIERFGYAF
jgi:sulfotransferase famil protein